MLVGAREEPKDTHSLLLALVSKVRDRLSLAFKADSLSGTFFLSHNHELHRKRRKPIEPYFSRMGVTKVEPLIHDCVAKLVERFAALSGTGQIVRLDHAMLAFSGDVIGALCVESPATLIDEEDFSPHWYTRVSIKCSVRDLNMCRYELQHSMIKCIPLFTEFPWLIK
jgi:cytochrome P450